MRDCLLMPCGHLLWKGRPLGSRLWCLIMKFSLSYWYPGSVVVLDCIDSWSLPPFLLWPTSELRVRLARRETGLSSPVFFFTDRSKAVLLLWSVCVIYLLCLPCFRVYSLLPCGHIKGKGWPLGSCLWCLLWFCYFPTWYPGTGSVLDCIDSWSLLSFLLYLYEQLKFRS